MREGPQLDFSPRVTLRNKLLILLRVPLVLQGTQTGPLEPVINAEQARTLLTDIFGFLPVVVYFLGEASEGAEAVTPDHMLLSGRLVLVVNAGLTRVPKIHEGERVA